MEFLVMKIRIFLSERCWNYYWGASLPQHCFVQMALPLAGDTQRKYLAELKILLSHIEPGWQNQANEWLPANNWGLSGEKVRILSSRLSLSLHLSPTVPFCIWRDKSQILSELTQSEMIDGQPAPLDQLLAWTGLWFKSFHSLYFCWRLETDSWLSTCYPHSPTE